MAGEDDIDPNKVAALGDTSSETAKAISTLVEKMAQASKELKEVSGTAESTSQAMREAERAGNGLGETFSGLVGMGSGLSKTMANLAAATNNSSNLVEGFTKSLTSNFNAMAVGVSVVEKMFEETTRLVYSTDAAFVSFQRQTGALSLYGSKITALEKKNYNFGITIDDAAESQASLVTGIRNFNTFSDSAQTSLLETTAMLNELGVESNITAESIGFMTNSLGMSTDAAATTSREMFALAQSMGMPPQEMAQSFSAAAPQLASFGSQANTVFQKMAINARKANMEVSDMLRITEQFDKFDTAASSVGKLNAALGGPYLSTIRMVTTTDPTERLKMMSQAAREAGKSFDSMDYYERKMLASAMGLKDVNELALVMSNEFDLMAPKIKRSAAQIKELAKQTQTYNQIGEEFNQLTRAFAVDIVKPLIDGLKMLANGLTYIAQKPMAWIAGGTAIATGAFIAFTVSTGGLGAIVTAVIGVLAGIVIAMKGLYDLVMKSAPALEIFGKAWRNIAPRLAEVQKRFAALTASSGSVQDSFDAFVRDNSEMILWVFDTLGELVMQTIEAMMRFGETVAHLVKVLWPLIKIVGYLFAGALASTLLITAAVVAGLVNLMTIFQQIYHFLFVGNSPSFLAVLGMVGSAITAVGNAFMFPIKMVGKLMTGLKDLAGLLAGKALSFLSGAISYVFGGSPEAQVSNNGFDRKEDMESKAVSIGEEVAKAVKEALQSVQLNSKVELEVTSASGLPTLFDYMQKGMDDVASGRPPNHAMNASRAGIG